MLIVETIARIRREHFIKGKTIKEIARDLKVSRNTVRKVLRSGETSFEYERGVQPRPKLGRWAAELDGLLAGNAAKAAREQLTLIRIFEELRGRGYDGGYDAVRRYARRWSKERGQSTAAAYVPLSFAPGEAYQFDWSHEVVLLNGVTVIVKAAHVRLCHSRMLFARCYPRETQEMVFDAHDRAFALFKGTCGRGIYDNMKTAVETIFVGKGRLYNRRFMQMCSHYLVDPVACTPASGWEKGQVENQVGLVRERFFTPRLRFKTLDELNAPGCWTNASPTPRRTGIRNCPNRRSGKCSKPNGRSSFPMPAGSMASMRCRHRSRRPAWCASTTTNTRSRPAQSGVRSRFMPMPTAS
jgi:transposase